MRHRRLRAAWGELVVASGSVLLRNSTEEWSVVGPIQIGTFAANDEREFKRAGYDQVLGEPDGSIRCTSTIRLEGGGVVEVVDLWAVDHSEASCTRSVRVLESQVHGAFLSTIELEQDGLSELRSSTPFIPAVLYGWNDFLPPYAIGSSSSRQAGATDFLVREDRLPAPLVAARTATGSSVALLHADPRGRTTQQDVSDSFGVAITDECFDFASVGIRHVDGRTRLCVWFPGTEGSVVYGSVATDGEKTSRFDAWRMRLHPIREGLVQRWQVAFRVGHAPDLPALVRDSWRWAYDRLAPPLVRHDLSRVESEILAHLSRHVQRHPDGAIGVPRWHAAKTGTPLRNGLFGLGFCARNESVAFHLIRVGHRERREDYLDQGREILDYWTTLTPSGIGPVTYRPGIGLGGTETGTVGEVRLEVRTDLDPSREVVSLRELAEGHHGCLLSWMLEQEHGVNHTGWLAWCVGFGEWLVGQELDGGGIPRWWKLDGTVVDPSTTGSTAAIPFLCLLSEVTERTEFATIAARAGDLLWTDYHRHGVFVGGTIDNPDVIDKEAAAIALEAYLALFRSTRDSRWVDRARVAADITETWTYLWDLPLPVDADPVLVDWSPDASTVGLQLIATGHSLADQYLAWNPGEYAELHALTGDPHYREVARLLLHNTKTMLALPDRLHGLAESGSQVESWHMVDHRGRGSRKDGHRAKMTTWATVAHVTGIHSARRFPAVMEEEMNNLTMHDRLINDGFVRIGSALPGADLEALRRTCERVLSRIDPETRTRTKSQGSMAKLSQDAAFADLIVHPAGIGALRSLGYSSASFSDGYLISKPPRSPRLFWHYDWFAWDDARSHAPEPPQVALMYYLTDTSRDNGCLRVIPGSHRVHNPLHDLLTEPHSRSLASVEDPGNPAFSDRPDEIDVPVRAGDILVVDARLLHASHANTTESPRSLLTLWYQPDMTSLPERIQAQMAAKRQEPPADWPPDARAKWNSVLVSYTGNAEPYGRQLYRRSGIPPT